MRWSLRLLLSFALLLALPSAAQPAPASPTTSPADLQRLLDAVVASGAPGAIGAVEDGGRTVRRVSGVGNLRIGQPPRPVQTFRVASQTNPGCCPTATRSPCASCSTTPAASTTPRSRSTRPSRASTTFASSTGRPGSDGPGGRGRAAVPAGHGLVLLQHQLRGRRPADRAGHRHRHRPAAGAAAHPPPGPAPHLVPDEHGRPAPPRLHGYLPLDDQPPLADADITRFNPSFFWASGALVSNVDDLDRFYDALSDGRLLPKRLLAEMPTPVDTGAPGTGYGLGLGLEIYTLPCGATVAGHTGALPGYNSGSFRLLGDDKDARVVANLHPAPDELYVAFSNALVALFCDLTPAQAAAAARAHPDRAAVIRFR